MSESIANLAKSFAQFQAEVKNPANSATNPQFRSKYAPLDVVINTAKPVLAKYGLSVMQSTGSEGESVIITSILMHESGEYIQSSDLVLPAYQVKGGGVKDFNAQGAGSAITYGRRYSLSAILGLSSEDDDDGNNASGHNSGYKDANSTPPKQNNDSDAVREAKRQEAIKKAQEAKANANSAPTPPANDAPAESSTASDVTPASPQQVKAIGNLITILAKKKDASDEALKTEYLAEFGVATLEALDGEQAKELITKINGAIKTA